MYENSNHVYNISTIFLHLFRFEFNCNTLTILFSPFCPKYRD